MPGSAPEMAAPEGGRADPPTVAAAVVAVVVAGGAAEGLEPTLASLGAQDHAALSVLVVDAGSPGLTERVAAVMPGAYVRAAPPPATALDAANSVIGTVEGAPYLLFVRTGAVLEVPAVRLLVEEAYRSNAGIAGAKIVDLERPEVLLEVGMSVDHYGVPFTGIEPGEIDQEQHDAVRDVFFVSSTAMLVRADLFAALGGFDTSLPRGVADLDLCWRAQLAGARVLAVPDARVRVATVQHAEEVIASHGPDAAAAMRGRLRVLLKCYSGLALVWVVPVALLLNVVEAVAFLVTPPRRRAVQLAAAWWHTLGSLPSTLAARRTVQRQRRVGDHEVRALMIRGSARVRSFVQHRLHAGVRLQDATQTAARAAEQARRRLERREVVAAIAGLVAVVVGSRSLIFGSVPEVGQLVHWPGARDLLGAFWSPWRYSELGSASPAPAAFGLLGVLSSALLGAVGLARTLLVVGAIPLGTFGAYRLARPLSATALPGLAAAVAYGANPLPRNLVAGGRLGALVLYALAPFVAARVFAAAGDPAFSTTRLRVPLRPVVVLGVLGALGGALWPPAVLLPVVLAAALLLAGPLVGGWTLVSGAWAAALRGAAISVLLLLPWAAIVADLDGATLGFLPRDPLDLDQLVRFAVGPHGTGFAALGVYVAAALPLLVAEGARLAWTARAWTLVALSLALAWVPGRLDPDLPVPEPGALLVPAAVGLALGAGLATAVFVEDLRRSLFGWRQVLAAAAVLGVLVPAGPFLVATLDGDWALPDRDWRDTLEWMEPEAATDGHFRVLWLGHPAVLPLDPRVQGRTGWGVSRDGAPDVRDLFLAPHSASSDVLEQAVELTADGRTARLGRLLAPMGVRYVVLVEQAGPTAKERYPADPVLRDSLGEQLDLAVARAESGIVVYENLAWVPALAIVPPESAESVPTGDVDPATAALRADIEGVEPVLGPRHATEDAGPGRLLWAEGYDDGWSATQRGEELAHLRSHGWANAWDVPGSGPIDVSFDGGLARPALVVVEVLLWAGALVVVRRRRAVAAPEARG
jgi:hypothetical protein